MPTNLLSRRDFLRSTAAAASIAVGARVMPADQTALERRQPMGLKLSCSSLAFSDMTWDVALAEIKKLEFRYADLAMFEGWTHVFPSALSDPEGHGKKIAAVCERLQIEPIAIHANFALGEPDKFPGLTIADPAARKTILSHFERVVTCARTAEIPLINVQPGKWIEGMPREICVKNAVDMLTQMHAMASRRGLVLSFENHTSSIAQQPEDALHILDEVPGLRLGYGTSHVVANSISVEQTSQLTRHVTHVGVRNAKSGSYDEPVRNGKLDYPIKPFLDAFRELNVNAYVSVEYFKPEKRDSIPALKAILEDEGIPVA